MQFDPATVSDAQEFSLLPPGIYRAMVNATALKSNKNSDGSHVAVEFGVVEGPFKGRKLWHNFNVSNPNETAQNIGRSQMKRFLAAIGVTTAVDLASQLPTVSKAKTLYLEVIHEPHYRDPSKQREAIKRFDAPTSASAPQAPKPQSAADSVPF